MATVQAHTGWPLKTVGMGKALWFRVKAILLGVFCFCFFFLEEYMDKMEEYTDTD